MPTKKVLVVDYDGPSLDSISKLLKNHKFQVVGANDGETGYSRFRSERPDLVILEAMLPKMHGFDLARRIGSESEGRVPIIVVSGLYKGAKVRQEALGPAGAAAFFEKPLDPAELLTAVRNLTEDEDGLEEALPDADAVLAALDARSRKRPAARGEERPSPKGQRR